MGQGDWAIQLEEEHGKLENQAEEELHQDIPEILGVAIFAEDIVVQDSKVMSIKQTVKGLIERVPFPIGRLMARVPFSVRLGSVYSQMRAECERIERDGISAQEEYALKKFRYVFEFARQKFPCYRELYQKAGVLDLEVKSLADVAKIPTIDKTWARAHFQEFHGAYRLNTGGSSGEPTAFWADKNCWAREWAHMHTIWEMLGYDYHDLKLAIRGKNLGRRSFAYNPVHNEYVINTYLSVKDYASKLERLFAKRDVKWFHGYPSSIYQFILECEEAFGKDGVRCLFKGVRGLLLSSEFPLPYMKEKFNEYGLKWISWYGHTEMCVLAYDKNCNNRYRPFATYGLAEVVDGHLIGTSFHNFDMPLIRYDTGDLVEATKVSEAGLVEEFAIKEGRSGDFIEDKNGKKIPLTALIFGRHHRVFDVADYVQIGQKEAGKATLYVTMRGGVVAGDLAKLFDLTNVDIDFEVKVVDKPIRTKAGKLGLRVGSG